MKLALTAALAFILCQASSAQSVHVVDNRGGPGVDFLSLQAAVDAAVTGDLLLVRSTTYEDVVVTAKSLVIQGDASSPLIHSLTVTQLASDEYLVFGGFLVDNIDLQSSSGRIWFEQVSTFLPVVHIQDCVNVVLKECYINGWWSAPVVWVEQPTMTITNSSVAFYEGGVGGTPGWCDPFDWFGLPGDGSPALDLHGSTLFAMGSIFAGGHGCQGGTDALSITWRMSSLETVESDLLPPPLVQGLVHWRDVPTIARGMTVEPLLREGETSPMTFTGEPGEEVTLYVSRRPGHWKTYPHRIGPRVVDQLEYVLDMGTVPASGVLETTFTAPQIPGETHYFFFQPAFVRNRNGVRSTYVYGAPEALFLLDGSL
jgi:hypothetical protein